MNSKQIMTAIACAAAFCGSVRAATNETTEGGPRSVAATNETIEAEMSAGWNWAMGEGLTYDEDPILATEIYLSFDSKYLSYGLVDNNDPIWTYGGEMCFLDWVTLGSFAINDMSRYGVAAGYKNRQGKAIEYHPTVNIGHSYGPDDISWLPTTIEFSLGFDYEYHPRVCTGSQWVDGEYLDGAPRGGDTYFYTLEFGLPDLWFEPAFLWEHDAMRDHGNYLNIEVGHTFALIDGDEEDDDPILTLRPSVAQGWGDERRISAYLSNINSLDENGESEPLEHQGLMDTFFKAELTWNICAGVSISGYFGYSDYLFDPSTREASRQYEATGAWNKSWNFVTGATLAVSF